MVRKVISWKSSLGTVKSAFKLNSFVGMYTFLLFVAETSPILTLTLTPSSLSSTKPFKLTLIPQPWPRARFECKPLNVWHLVKQRDFVSNPPRALGGKVDVMSYFPPKYIYIYMYLILIWRTCWRKTQDLTSCWENTSTIFYSDYISRMQSLHYDRFPAGTDQSELGWCLSIFLNHM